MTWTDRPVRFHIYYLSGPVPPAFDIRVIWSKIVAFECNLWAVHCNSMVSLTSLRIDGPKRVGRVGEVSWTLERQQKQLVFRFESTLITFQFPQHPPWKSVVFYRVSLCFVATDAGVVVGIDVVVLMFAVELNLGHRSNIYSWVNNFKLLTPSLYRVLAAKVHGFLQIINLEET